MFKRFFSENKKTVNMRGYSDKMRENNLLEVKNDHERTSALFSLNKKYLNGIWVLIESQPLLREIVTIYIIKDLSTCVIY